MRGKRFPAETDMTGRLDGKTALIIGAGSVGEGWGNGRAAAILFAREGARVFGADRDQSALARTAELADSEGLDFLSRTADVTDNGELDALIDAAHQSLGRIDILVNNVGGSAPGDAVSMSDEIWERQIATNLTYVFQSMKRVIPLMVGQGGGAIVNLASIAALRFFGPDVAGYAASKAGLMHFSRVTAVKYAPHHVRVNTVIPGLMNTPLVKARLAGERAGGEVETLVEARHRQVPMGHMGEGWDIANAVLFLASDEARYITATELTVDGGLSASCVAPHPMAD
jgi:NAD(P)-dependent dehydrogenase (short-subunit alcohol dehydrogenase family)